MPRRSSSALAALVLLAFVVAARWAASGAEPAIPSVLGRGGIEAGEDTRWMPATASGLSLSPHFIAGPAAGEDRSAWLAAMRAYRRSVREGADELLEVDFRGVRAWARLAWPLAEALDPAPSEALEVSLEARWLEGNPELCVAFDVHERVGGAKTGWSTVQAVLPVPRDGSWHRVEASVKVPSFDRGASRLRPILGMDATHDPEPGRLHLRSLRLSVADATRMSALGAARAALPAPGLDRRIYDRADTAWAARAFACHFTFVYDRSFWDPEAGRYRLEEFLDEGAREFGGYDSILLWQGYPRLGVDPRNQLDIYRDLPGGLAGLRDLVGAAHRRGTRVFIDYNPWDRGTRPEGRSDEEALAEIVAALDADGIFLDTMSAGSRRLRDLVDAARPGVVFAPEGHPEIDQLSICTESWAQWIHDPMPPGLLHLKWIEPRHMQHQIRRWDRSHAAEIETAFFNGSGMLIWENIFGTWNPWPAADRRLWRRAVAILRRFSANVTSDDWDPFHPTLATGLHAHRWPAEDSTLYTLLNLGAPLRDAPLLEVEAREGVRYLDLWAGREIDPEVRAGKTVLRSSIDRLGAVAVVRADRLDPGLEAALETARREGEAERSPAGTDARAAARSVVTPAPIVRTAAAPADRPPPGMVLVPGARFRMRIEHMRRECGCYPDPGTPEARWPEFLQGTPHDGTIRHDIPVEVEPFLIDEAEVSNADFGRFLETTGYRPRHPERFLAAWPDGKMPEGAADEPVVYVDIDDARAYARWAGKRLPTEEEWHLAAQGTDGRKWPWGGDLDPSRANASGKPMPVRSLPEGRSPFGCYHMSGNVWEWTESVRDDGHTRFAIIRGGSWFDAKGSIWYVRGGPQPCDHHAKMLLLWPGLDRCSTVGFRCVKDVVRT